MTDLIGDEDVEIEATLNGQAAEAARQGAPAPRGLPAT